MRLRILGGMSFAAAAMMIAGASAMDKKELESGLQPGEFTGAFQCRNVTGPDRGKSLCLV